MGEWDQHTPSFPTRHTALIDRMIHPVEWSPDNLIQTLLYSAVFILVDLSAGALGMALEKRGPWKDFLWLSVQRFGYRQFMYYVVVKALITAVRGPRVGRGQLERRGRRRWSGWRSSTDSVPSLFSAC